MNKEAATHKAHRDEAPSRLACALITVSDTRTLRTDHSGALMAALLEAAGHRVLSRRLVRDEAADIELALLGSLALEGCDAVLLTGGTGPSPRDVTAPVVERHCERLIPGFGELFRFLSWDQVGAAAMLSAAVAGIRGRQAIVAIPGSEAAVRLAMEKLLLPELGHLLREARRGE